jgi:group II intron reverse transcriptase/maturase
MRTAETILGIIQNRGSRGLPLEDVYRQLYNPALYLTAYGKLYKNAGAMTPGATPETVDGMSLEKIQATIEALRCERYQWTPVRRTYIEKKNSTKKRPLGLPTWSDKVLQEVMRLMFEAYYEPQFSDHSHGFRRNRGCHTALREIYYNWTGTTWFIEGDISAYFDTIDHEVMLSILRENIHDNRFLRLIDNLLKAGYLEEWQYNRTLSGTPQGGVISPILSNIYLDRLDKFVENTLMPAYTRGKERGRNKLYNRATAAVSRLRRQGRIGEAQDLSKVLRNMPTRDPNDLNYRRLKYVRYADDFLLGFTGPRTEAEDIKRQLGQFLQETLKLELSDTKTLLTHASTETARFLSYEISITRNNERRNPLGNRSFNGVPTLRIPREVVQADCKPYMARNKPIHRVEVLQDDIFSIISQYQAEYRGVVNYYSLATNLRDLSKLRWVMEMSLTKTLAHKLKISVRQVYKRLRTVLSTPSGPRLGLQMTVTRANKPPLLATWGGIGLARNMKATLNDTPLKVWSGRTELIKRLLADTCELCGSQDRVQVHHIRALRDLRKWGRAERPAWVIRMATRHRKTLVVCQNCHRQIHRDGNAGNVTARRRRDGLLESRMPGNSQVRFGGGSRET